MCVCVWGERVVMISRRGSFGSGYWSHNGWIRRLVMMMMMMIEDGMW